MPKKSTFVDYVQKEIKATQDSVDFSRRMDRSAEELNPGEPRGKFDRAVHELMRELRLAMWLPMKVTLILLLNLICLPLLLWLLFWLLSVM